MGAPAHGDGACAGARCRIFQRRRAAGALGRCLDRLAVHLAAHEHRSVRGYPSPRPLHTGHDGADVPDHLAGVSDIVVHPQRALPEWTQVWRSTDDRHGHAGRVRLVHDIARAAGEEAVGAAAATVDVRAAAVCVAVGPVWRPPRDHGDGGGVGQGGAAAGVFGAAAQQVRAQPPEHGGVFGVRHAAGVSVSGQLQGRAVHARPAAKPTAPVRAVDLRGHGVGGSAGGIARTEYLAAAGVNAGHLVPRSGGGHSAAGLCGRLRMGSGHCLPALTRARHR
eukprot:ctg_166.g96